MAGPSKPPKPPKDVQTVNSVQPDTQTIAAPIDPKANPTISSPYGPRGGRMHRGIDVAVSDGTGCFAPVDGTIVHVSTSGFGNQGGMVHFRFGSDVGTIKKGAVIGWGHPTNVFVRNGQTVRAGQKVCASNYGSAPHVHFVYLPEGNGGGSQIDGTADPEAIFSFLQKGKAPTVGGTAADAGGAGGGGEDVFAVARAGAIANSFTLPGVVDRALSNMLTGERSVMNDEPLFDFIEQLCNSSLRQFQSLPDGTFYAFFPDYFGSYLHRRPYWSIDDIEIVEGKIDLTDDSLATHVMVAGDWLPDGSVSNIEMMMSKGMVSIFDALRAGIIAGSTLDQPSSSQIQDAVKDLGDALPKHFKTPKERQKAIKEQIARNESYDFLTRYGVRPLYKDEPLIRNGFFETFSAIQEFMKAWSSQFLTDFTFTFMPELFPGGIVQLEQHGVQCYVESVVHNFDYEGGFTTQAQLSSPASVDGSNPAVSDGMVRPPVPAGDEYNPFLGGEEGEIDPDEVDNTTNSAGR